VLERATREERGGQSRYTEVYLRMKSHREVTDDPRPTSRKTARAASTPSCGGCGERAGVALARALSIADPNLIERLAERAGDTIAWLEGLGVRFEFLLTQFTSRSRGCFRWVEARRW
jgi:tricarballylate dehydrogenase